MRILFDLRSYPARLVLGVFALILLTTLSAGVPAYWLTRTESERQAWSHVAGAEQSTASLLTAEQERLDDLLMLLAERPTLLRLLREQNFADLAPYLRAFQEQSELDILFLCQVGASADRPAVPPARGAACPEHPPTGFGVHASRPTLLSSHPVFTPAADSPALLAVAGRWLDQGFLRRMAADTGVVQSILLPDGTRFASSLDEGFLSPATSEVTFAPGGRRVLDVDGKRFYTRLIPLHNQDGATAFFLEVALPVDELLAARYRALAVLALSTGFVALLGTLLAVWAVRRMFDPLEQLTRTAEAISAGDLTTPIPSLPGPREVRTLVASLQRSQASMLGALEDLAQAHAWLESLVRSIVEGVVMFDDAGRVVFVNDKAADLAAVSADEAIGRPIDELFAASDESGNRLYLQRLAPNGRHRVNLVNAAEPGARPLRRPGQPTLRRLGASQLQPDVATMLEVTVTRLAAPDGLMPLATATPAAQDGKRPEQELHTALILRDISEEESLRHLRSYFLANITHEFRTPLSTLNASMELMMGETDLSAAEMRELLKPLHLSLLSLQTLIENLLESSSIEAGRFVVRRQPVDLNQVIADAVHIVQPLLERMGHTLSLSEPIFLPPLLGDSARLMQVLVNLLSNAAKYSRFGSEITLHVEQRDRSLRVAVADQGPGIPQQEREQIFRRFTRLHAGVAEQYGIGLGLYVVKSTIAAHGGRVGVDENPGGGSRFWFELPIEQAEQPEQAEQAEKTEKAEQAEQAEKNI